MLPSLSRCPPIMIGEYDPRPAILGLAKLLLGDLVAQDERLTRCFRIATEYPAAVVEGEAGLPDVPHDPRYRVQPVSAFLHVSELGRHVWRHVEGVES